METPVDMTFSIVILTSSDYDSGDINKYKKTSWKCSYENGFIILLTMQPHIV